jgi:hypothetical protein
VPNPEKMQEAIETLNEQIAQWDDPNYITAEQIESAKEMLDIDDQYSKEQTSDYVHTVTYWWASASLEYYSNYINNIKAVTREDIKNYIDKYIKGKPYVAGLLVSPAMKKMLPIDSIFKVAGDIESLSIKANKNDNIVFDDASAKTLSTLKELMQLNPDKKVNIDVYAAKSTAAETRAYQLKSKLKEMGIAEEKVAINYHVKKDKELSEADKSKQNTIRFSF